MKLKIKLGRMARNVKIPRGGPLTKRELEMRREAVMGKRHG